MLTERAYDIVRKLIAFIDISADLTYITLLAFRFRLRLNVLLVVCVGHGLLVREHSRLGHGADEHTMCIKIDIVLDLQGHEGVDVTVEEDQSVIRADDLFFTGKLIDVSATLETEVLEHLERRFHGKAVHVHDPRLLDDMMRIVLLVDRHSGSVYWSPA